MRKHCSLNNPQPVTQYILITNLKRNQFDQNTKYFNLFEHSDLCFSIEIENAIKKSIFFRHHDNVSHKGTNILKKTIILPLMSDIKV